MIKVIETNLSFDDKGKLHDHQSRVIEVDDWKSFVEEIKNGKTETRHSCFGDLQGCTIPRNAKIENLTYDNLHLMCDVYNYAGQYTKKLIYKAGD